jgi:hypothetical protein
MKISLITFLCFMLTVSCKQKETAKPIENPTTTVLTACSKDAKQCPNGRVVGRNPENNCEFDPCPEVKPAATNTPQLLNEKMCTADMHECPDGSFVSRDHSNNCKFKDCPSTNNGRSEIGKKEAMMCTADVQECPDGSYVGRDHYNNCKFKACPDSDTKLEPDSK